MAFSSFALALSVVALGMMVTSAPPPAPAPAATGATEALGFSISCGANETFQQPLLAGGACNTYFRCRNGTVSVHTCEAPFFLTVIQPFYNAANNCCDFVSRPVAVVRPDEHGNCRLFPLVNGTAVNATVTTPAPSTTTTTTAAATTAAATTAAATTATLQNATAKVQAREASKAAAAKLAHGSGMVVSPSLSVVMTTSLASIWVVLLLRG